MVKRVKTVQESDLRMLGSLARNIQRVLPVTRADIDAAAALGKGWVVWKVFEVSDPLDNLRGGTQLIIRQNSVQPGQNVRRVIFVSGPGGQTVVIRGTDYIVLPDAIANSLSYVKAFGGTEQRNIPQPYTQVNYVTNTAQTAIDTGIMIDFAKNYEFEVECRAVSGSWYILQSRASASGNVTGIHGETSGSNIKLVVGNVTVCTSAITRTVGNKLYVKATLNAGTATLYVKDETANTEDTQTGSYGTTQPNPTAAVYLLGNAGGQYVDVNSDIYMARIKENDTVVMDYVPCRQVATAGFYDKASGTFKTALTPANLSADGNTVPAPDAPMDIVSNNGVVKYTPNLLDMAEANIVLGKYIDNDGSIKSSTNNFYNNKKILVTAGGNYTWSASTSIKFLNIMEYTSNDVFIRRTQHRDVSSGTVTLRSDTAYVLIGSNPTSSTVNMNYINSVNWQFEKGSTASVYQPYRPTQIYADGTVETINARTRNVCNAQTPVTYTYQDATQLKDLTPANYAFKENTRYAITFWFTAQDIQYSAAGNLLYVTVRYTDGTSTYLGITSGNVGSSPATVTTAASKTVIGIRGFTKHSRWTGGSITLSQIQIEEGTSATDYIPYYDGGTATCENLFALGNDYVDEQEIISGAVTRNVGVKALDGTEGWVDIDGRHTCSAGVENILPSSAGGLCNYLPVFDPNNPSSNYIVWSSTLIEIGIPGTSIADLTAWLADQYAAGTPVIVVYPLATPTTESVAGQTLQVTDGDNVVEITQAGMDGLELEVQYDAAVSLTIQEVQDANLDNNVTVTIQ